jgi:hypothetical protein
MEALVQSLIQHSIRRGGPFSLFHFPPFIQHSKFNISEGFLADAADSADFAERRELVQSLIQHLAFNIQHYSPHHPSSILPFPFKT